MYLRCLLYHGSVETTEKNGQPWKKVTYQVNLINVQESLDSSVPFTKHDSKSVGYLMLGT